MRPLFPPWARPATVLVVLACASCDGSPTSETQPRPRLHLQDAAHVVFMTQNVVPAATMDALFQGRVVADRAGCLRLDSPDPPTVVWPHGYRVRVGPDGVRILDRDGHTVGSVGKRFSLGGGEVPALADGMGFTEADRELAESRCPGRYWIVG